MTAEIKSLASSYLSARGWTYSGDARKLAERIEDCCHDFLMELEASIDPEELDEHWGNTDDRNDGSVEVEP